MDVIVIPVTAFVQNTTLFACEKTGQAVVIDPGGDVDKIIEQIEKNNVELNQILLTHGHVDHVGGVVDLLAYKKVPVVGPHRADQFWIDAVDQQCQMFGFPSVKHFTPDRWLVQGDKVCFGEVELDVLHCPGHTPGHVVFLHRESLVAQVGDVLFQGSIGRTDFPQGNHEQLISSIKEQLLTLPEETTFIPGHGPSSTIGQEKVSNPYFR